MLHVVYTTIAAQYFPEATQGAIAKSLMEAGSAATADAAILHLGLEADAEVPGAGLTATLWAGHDPKQVRLGRADFHGAWVSWSPSTTDVPVNPAASV